MYSLLFFRFLVSLFYISQDGKAPTTDRYHNHLQMFINAGLSLLLMIYIIDYEHRFLFILHRIFILLLRYFAEILFLFIGMLHFLYKVFRYFTGMHRSLFIVLRYFTSVLRYFTSVLRLRITASEQRCTVSEHLWASKELFRSGDREQSFPAEYWMRIAEFRKRKILSSHHASLQSKFNMENRCACLVEGIPKSD